MLAAKTSGKNTTLWLETYQPTSFLSLNCDVESEVCVIGGGISGLTVAYCLANVGVKVVVLEDGLIGSGETGRTTAHLSNALDDRYENIISVHGIHKAKLAADSHSMAIDLIEEICKKEKIDCDFSRLKGYLFAANTTNVVNHLNEEEKAAKKCGVKVNFSPDRYLKLEGKMLTFEDQAEFHPLKYLQGLAKSIVEKGGHIYEHTHVESIETQKKKMMITTSNHKKVIANKVVQATNIPISTNLSLHTKQEAYRTYVVAALIPASSYEKALYWDTADPYHYVRFYHDKANQEHFIIIGGEDHRTGTQPQQDPFVALEKWGKHYFPQMQNILYKWSGQVVEPVDYLAFIGLNPNGDENNYIITGDSGNGLTHGTLSAILLSQMILQEETEWTNVYYPSRTTFKPIKDFLSHNLHMLYSYLQYLKSADIKSENAMLINSGGIIKKGMHRIAVYRDKNGKFHHFSGFCPHLKAPLQWNAIESTWDCPAHGSRFSALGEVINSPANCNLECIK